MYHIIKVDYMKKRFIAADSRSCHTHNFKKLLMKLSKRTEFLLDGSWYSSGLLIAFNDQMILL